MDNFSILNHQNIRTVVEVFFPGGSSYITPIAYYAYTPDIFLFLFRLTINGDDKFFVIFTFDYVKSPREDSEKIIKKVFNASAKYFVEPEVPVKINPDGSVAIDEAYCSLMIEVGLPKSVGYWRNNIAVTKDDDLEKTLSKYPESVLTEVKRLLSRNEDLVVGVYKNDNNEYEYFYNPRVDS